MFLNLNIDPMLQSVVMVIVEFIVYLEVIVL